MKSAREFFKDLGTKHLFARYRTPSDNGWIESWSRILKHDWLKYKEYVSFDQLKVIIEKFVLVYNTEPYHGAMGYVTRSRGTMARPNRSFRRGLKGDAKPASAPARGKPSIRKSNRVERGRTKNLLRPMQFWA